MGSIAGHTEVLILHVGVAVDLPTPSIGPGEPTAVLRDEGVTRASLLDEVAEEAEVATSLTVRRMEDVAGGPGEGEETTAAVGDDAHTAALDVGGRAASRRRARPLVGVADAAPRARPLV